MINIPETAQITAAQFLHEAAKQELYAALALDNEDQARAARQKMHDTLDAWCDAYTMAISRLNREQGE